MTNSNAKLPEREVLSFFIVFVVLYCFFVLRQWAENFKSIAICHPSITFFLISLSDKAGDLEHTVTDDPASTQYITALLKYFQ